MRQLRADSKSIDDYFIRASEFIERRQFVAAIRLLEIPARNGKSDAQLMLGFCHDMRGVAGRAIALRWYRRAAASGEASAAVNIATIYRDARHTRLARAWYWRAVKMGMPEALLDIALLLHGKRREKALRRLLRHKGLIPAVKEHAQSLLGHKSI